MAARDNARWRRIAGSLELFLGSYFAACGCLAILFLLSLENRDGVLLSLLGLLFGLLLMFRAGHLLAWKPLVFRAVAIVLAPVAWVTPAFLAASTLHGDHPREKKDATRSAISPSATGRCITAAHSPGGRSFLSAAPLTTSTGTPILSRLSTCAIG
jgi:hypothetical protein